MARWKADGMTTLLEAVEARVEHEHMRHKQEDHRQQDQDCKEAEELSIRAGTDSTTERKQKSIKSQSEKTRDQNQTQPARRKPRPIEPPEVRNRHRKSEESNKERRSCQDEKPRGQVEGHQRRRGLEA
jgi:hypothetical protein